MVENKISMQPNLSRDYPVRFNLFLAQKLTGSTVRQLF